MPAVPKKKSPKSRQGKRRSHLQKKTTALSECPQCHSARLPHHACPVCGHYKGRQAITIGVPELPT